MNQSLITVLMPVYNAERFLAPAIQSILNQSFTAFEFLIIDDGSTDSTPEIVNRFSDSRIHFVQNPANLGITATLNKGIELATAPLIARMDADDMSLPNRLERQFEMLQQNPDAAFVASWVYEINQDGTQCVPRPFELSAYYYNLHFTCWIYHPAVAFRKSAVEAIGGYACRYAEDFDLWWRLMQQYRFMILPEYLVKYRETDESLHKVAKKAEYEQAQHQLVLRNLAAVDPTISFSFEQVECLRSEFDPILQVGDVNMMADLLQKMDRVTDAIAKTANRNCIPVDVYNAGHAHKKQVLRHLLRKLPKKKSLELAARTGCWSEYYVLVKGFLQQKMKQ